MSWTYFRVMLSIKWARLLAKLDCTAGLTTSEGQKPFLLRCHKKKSILLLKLTDGNPDVRSTS